jgi:hypothetical protein
MEVQFSARMLPVKESVSALLEVDCLFAQYLVMRRVLVRYKFHEGLNGMAASPQGDAPQIEDDNAEARTVKHI